MLHLRDIILSILFICFQIDGAAAEPISSYVAFDAAASAATAADGSQSVSAHLWLRHGGRAYHVTGMMMLFCRLKIFCFDFVAVIVFWGGAG